MCWDPSARVKTRVPVLEVPFHIGDYDAKFVLKVLDLFMTEASGLVKGLVCDAHKAHRAMKRIFTGFPTATDKQLMESLRLNFLPKLQHRSLPESCLPRLPVKIAHMGGEVYHLFPGACLLATDSE